MVTILAVAIFKFRISWALVIYEPRQTRLILWSYDYFKDSSAMNERGVIKKKAGEVIYKFEGNDGVNSNQQISPVT
ncbi:MAG: hypothetical protein Q8S55_02720 [Methylococcaceae bacterium]|nr:hypothetical protein [Methylococcaceae bacterium]